MQTIRPKTSAKEPQLLNPTATNAADTAIGYRDKPIMTTSAIMEEMPILALRKLWKRVRNDYFLLRCCWFCYRINRESIALPVMKTEREKLNVITTAVNQATPPKTRFISGKSSPSRRSRNSSLRGRGHNSK